MKLIEVLSKLEECEIPNKTKFKWRDSIVINKKGTLYCNDMFFSRILNFGNIEALKEELEIIEEDGSIERIRGLNHPSTERLSSIREDIGLAFKTIDKLIDKVNKLEKEKRK